jgi:hypothetical protein
VRIGVVVIILPLCAELGEVDGNGKLEFETTSLFHNDSCVSCPYLMREASKHVVEGGEVETTWSAFDILSSNSISKETTDVYYIPSKGDMSSNEKIPDPEPIAIKFP